MEARQEATPGAWPMGIALALAAGGAPASA